MALVYLNILRSTKNSSSNYAERLFLLMCTKL
jgi:hypothetical protein